jgi:hypothetical protein
MFADAPLRFFFFLSFFFSLSFQYFIFDYIFSSFLKKKLLGYIYFFLQKKKGNNVEKNGDASHSPILAEEMYFQADDLHF